VAIALDAAKTPQHYLTKGDIIMSAHYDRPSNVMDYTLQGTYRHERPDCVSAGVAEHRGEYRVTWAKDLGYLVYFGTGTPQTLEVHRDRDGAWLKTKNYDSTPPFARTRFVPDAGELSRIGAE
jgi:hypothetical protein